MMKVMVFGGAGYIGIPLCEELRRRGHMVMAIDRFFFEKEPDVACLRSDIRDCDARLNEAWSVVDLAGLSNDASAEIDPELTKEINEDGGKKLATMAKEAGVKRYIYSSSASVYGHGTKTHLSEFDVLNPLTAYARSKIAVEEHLRKIAGDGFEPVILRNATVFGVSKRMRFDLAVNLMTLGAWRDKRIEVRGGGAQMRPFVHINDVVNIFIRMLELPADVIADRTINVGSDVLNYSISDIARIVRNELFDASISYLRDEPDNRSYHLSFKQLRDLGLDCQFSVECGVNDIRYALDTGTIYGSDPSTVTLAWYKELMTWEDRLNKMRLNGRII